MERPLQAISRVPCLMRVMRTGSPLSVMKVSTAYFVMGAKEAAEFWKKGGEAFLMLTDGGELFVTEDLAGHFTPDEAWKRAKVTVIRR